MTPSLRYAANGDSEMEVISQSYRQPENSVNHRFRRASNSSTRTEAARGYGYESGTTKRVRQQATESVETSEFSERNGGTRGCGYERIVRSSVGQLGSHARAAKEQTQSASKGILEWGSGRQAAVI